MRETIETGNALLDQHRYDEADQLFERLAQKQPDRLEPLRGLIKVARTRGYLPELMARLARFLELQPDALEERTNWIQLRASRGEIGIARMEIPKLLRIAGREPFDRRTGKRLQQLIQFATIGSSRTKHLLKLQTIVQSLIGKLSNSHKDKTGRRDRLARLNKLFSFGRGHSDLFLSAINRLEAEILLLNEQIADLKVFQPELCLSLGDYDEFVESVGELERRAKRTRIIRDLGNVRDRIASDGFCDFGQEKVFGIGLSRTGTSSLHIALRNLGLHSLHWNNPMTGDLISKSDFALYDAFSDIPVSHQFEWLYYTFPNSKFILTYRDAESWSKSVTNHYADNHGISSITELSTWPSRNKFEFKSARMTMNLYAQHKSWPDAHEKYHQRVFEFFESKPEHRFLEMNIIDGDGYEKLCPFLGLPILEKSFPNVNATARPSLG